MAEYDGTPRCRNECQFPDGAVPRYNCDGYKTIIIGSTDVTGIAEGLSQEDRERIGRPVDVRVCGNAALKSIDASVSKRLGLIQEI